MPTAEFNLAPVSSSSSVTSSMLGSLGSGGGGLGQSSGSHQSTKSSPSPLAHLGLGGHGSSSPLIGQLNLGVLTSNSVTNSLISITPSLDPNAKTYTPKNNSSLISSTEA